MANELFWLRSKTLSLSPSIYRTHYSSCWFFFKYWTNILQQSFQCFFLFFATCVSGTGPASSSSSTEAAEAWLFPSESSETLRSMGSRGKEGLDSAAVKCDHRLQSGLYNRGRKKMRLCLINNTNLCLRCLCISEQRHLVSSFWLKQITLLILAWKDKVYP